MRDEAPARRHHYRIRTYTGGVLGRSDAGTDILIVTDRRPVGQRLPFGDGGYLFFGCETIPVQ